MRSVAAPWMAWMLVTTRPFAETTKPSTMPVGPGEERRRSHRFGEHLDDGRRLGLGDRARGERSAAVVARPADDGLLGDALDGSEARVDAPGREAATDQADHRAQHDGRDEPVPRPDGRGHSAGAAARCLR